MNRSIVQSWLGQLLPAAVLIIPMIAISQQNLGNAKGTIGFNGVSLSVASVTVPPGGLLQIQVSLTEPKPILKGKQGILFASSAVRAAALPLLSAFAASAVPGAAALLPPANPLSVVRDATLFGPGGNVSGVAVLGSSGLQVFFKSPAMTFGTNVDAPVITVSMPVSSRAAVGQTVNLMLDPNTTQWFDPTSALYPVEVKPGLLTVGGTLSITDIIPGEGIVPAGQIIVIKGFGFDSQSKVQVNEATVSGTQFISSNELHITLSTAFDLRGKRVRLENRAHELVTYFPSGRSELIGISSHPLIADSYPFFAETVWTAAYFRPSAVGTVFTGLALQNRHSAAASVTLQLRTAAGGLLSTQKMTLAAGTHIVRDVAEMLPTGMALIGTSLKVSSNLPVQMLGMRGDDASGVVLPVDPSLLP